MSAHDDARRVNLSLEDRPIGEYVIDATMWFRDALDQDPERFVITFENAFTLRQHLDNAIDSLANRRTIDALCGSCDLCGNTRMVHPLRYGRPVAEHCPTCHPKIEAAKIAFKNGTPP